MLFPENKLAHSPTKNIHLVTQSLQRPWMQSDIKYICNIFNEWRVWCLVEHPQLSSCFWSGGFMLFPFSLGLARIKIRLIESNAKCCHLKKLICKGTLRQLFICLKPRTPYNPPPHLHSVYVYTYTQGRGEGETWTREKGRGVTVHQAGSKIPTWLTVSPVYKFWQTPATNSLNWSIF